MLAATVSRVCSFSSCLVPHFCLPPASGACYNTEGPIFCTALLHWQQVWLMQSYSFVRYERKGVLLVPESVHSSDVFRQCEEFLGRRGEIFLQ